MLLLSSQDVIPVHITAYSRRRRPARVTAAAFRPFHLARFLMGDQDERRRLAFGHTRERRLL